MRMSSGSHKAWRRLTLETPDYERAGNRTELVTPPEADGRSVPAASKQGGMVRIEYQHGLATRQHRIVTRRTGKPRRQNRQQPSRSCARFPVALKIKDCGASAPNHRHHAILRIKAKADAQSWEGGNLCCFR